MRGKMTLDNSYYQTDKLELKTWQLLFFLSMQTSNKAKIFIQYGGVKVLLFL